MTLLPCRSVLSASEVFCFLVGKRPALRPSNVQTERIVRVKFAGHFKPMDIALRSPLPALRPIAEPSYDPCHHGRQFLVVLSDSATLISMPTSLVEKPGNFFSYALSRCTG